MYGLPQDTDLSFFKEKELEFLGLGICIVRLDFDEKIELSINGSFTFNKKLLEPKDGYILHELIGKKITSAKHGKGPGDLQLNFEGDNELILHDDSEQYESYNFWGPEGLTVV